MPIRSMLPATEHRPLLSSPMPSTTANDNATPAAPTRTGTRSIYRDLFFLAVFAATIAGTFYIGRLNAYQNVIVVPDSSSRHSAIA